MTLVCLEWSLGLRTGSLGRRGNDEAEASNDKRDETEEGARRRLGSRRRTAERSKDYFADEENLVTDLVPSEMALQEGSGRQG